jgi:hypothetical protein
MSKRLIRNGVVKMEWDADSFFEVGGECVAAVHCYNGVPVVFKDNSAFILMNESSPDDIADLNEITRILQETVRNGYILSEDYEHVYVPLFYSGQPDEVTFDSYGVGMENVGDINARIMDLAPYFAVEYVDDINDAF